MERPTNNQWTADGRYLAAVTGRMESVEVFDAAEMAVVDDFRLSTVGRRVRFMSAVPGPGARRIFLVPVVVDLESDRFIHQTPSEIWVFDRERREVIHEIPLGDASDWRPNIHFSPDGSSIYLVNDQIVELDAETFEETDRIELDRPLAPGYGGVRGHSLSEIEPGRLFGVYRTTEPSRVWIFLGCWRSGCPTRPFATTRSGPPCGSPASHSLPTASAATPGSPTPPCWTWRAARSSFGRRASSGDAPTFP